jgi:hypothetical protein
MNQSQSTSIGGTPTEELQAVKEMVSSFVVALRVSALYPEDHSVLEKPYGRMWNLMEACLGEMGSLKLNVEKDKLIFSEQVVHQGALEEGDLAFVLFRDGIRWLEFLPGFQYCELVEFIKLLNRYRCISEQPDGDLVTALWEVQLPHLRYEAIDILWEADPNGDASMFDDAEQNAKGYCYSLGHDTARIRADTGSRSAVGPAVELSQREEAILKKWVRDAETESYAEDALNVLMETVQAQKKDVDSSAIFDYVEEEFGDALIRGDFSFAYEILKRINKIGKIHAKDKTWLSPYVKHFLFSCSSPQNLSALQNQWEKVEANLEEVKGMLLLLPPVAIETLGPMSIQAPSFKIQRMIVDVLKSLASQDLHPLENLLTEPDDELVRRMVYVLSQLDGERPARALLKMVHHPSEAVRKEALKGLLVRGPQVRKRLYSLIDNGNDVIRHTILEYLGWRKDEEVEDFLLNYLRRRKFRRKERHTMLGCYRALGRCGSDRSVAFLKQSLLSQSLVPFFSKTRRQAAAIALSSLGTDAAYQTLEKASRGISPTVRLAVKKAREEEKRKRWKRRKA